MYYPDLYQYEKNSGIDSNTADSEGIDSSESYDGYESGLTRNGYINTTSGLLTIKNTSYRLSINNDNIKDEAYLVIYNKSTYWLSSRYIYVNTVGSDYVIFGLRKCGSELSSNALYQGWGIGQSGASCSMRPVVTLKANTQIEKCSGSNSNSNPHHIVTY